MISFNQTNQCVVFPCFCQSCIIDCPHLPQVTLIVFWLFSPLRLYVFVPSLPSSSFSLFQNLALSSACLRSVCTVCIKESFRTISSLSSIKTEISMEKNHNLAFKGRTFLLQGNMATNNATNVQSSSFLIFPLLKFLTAQFAERNQLWNNLLSGAFEKQFSYQTLLFLLIDFLNGVFHP